MKAFPKKPIYLVPETSVLHYEYEDVIAGLKNTADLHTLTITFPTKSVTDLRCGYLNELIAVLQHHPTLVKQLVYAISFKFLEVPDSELYIKKEDWINDPAYWRWFNEMREQSPVAPFFLHGYRERSYCFIGDLLADGKGEIKQIDDDKGELIGFKGEDLNLIANRLFDSCLWYHVYCHGSKFDPRDTVEWLIADTRIPISYKVVRKEYQKKVSKPLYLRLTRTEADGTRTVL
ncbi:MAG: hypothetical protein ACYDCN_00070 [Bacteroidia bacterium]